MKRIVIYNRNMDLIKVITEDHAVIETVKSVYDGNKIRLKEWWELYNDGQSNERGAME